MYWAIYLSVMSTYYLTDFGPQRLNHRPGIDSAKSQSMIFFSKAREVDRCLGLAVSIFTVMGIARSVLQRPSVLEYVISAQHFRSSGLMAQALRCGYSLSGVT
jgi:hypothetical protein